MNSVGYAGHCSPHLCLAEEHLPEPEGLKDAMQAAQNDAGEVSCAKLWQLAATHHVPRLQVGYLADQFGIHVTPCQLGAF